MDKGRSDEARRLLVSYLEQHPDAVAERRLLVRVEAFRGQLGLAQQQVLVLFRVLGPASPIPSLELGHALEVAHRYDEALSAYDRAAEVAPRDASGPLTGGLRAARWGELELALPRLEEAVRRDAKNPAAWHALGLVRLSGGDTAGAQQAYGAGLLADPKALENRVGLATVALARRDLAAALVQYDAIIRQRARLPDAYLGRSFALMGLGRLAEASAAIDEAARLGGDPKVIEAQRRALAQRAGRHAVNKPTGTAPP